MKTKPQENSMNITLIYKGTLKGTMAIKSLTITEDAYNALKRNKLGKESFSQVILRVTQEKKGKDLTRFFGILKGKDGEEFEKRIRENRKKVAEEIKEREKRFWGEK